ncbi:MAG: polyribonucleotide nucleotidyltransferase [Firmicutes bacterium HGW-Firmicutes-9]|jgi:polyribonucleotide nucleotidyltransferase|nr:MAG: polyribonucleotide nucleotidyltransferase [Firmicutes bacterium HGW-Firmicutes-9]
MERNFQMQLGGKTLIVETGKYAEQAGGSALVRLGDTAVLVCATIAKTARDGVDFLPLSVEYQEKLYSVGKIPGGFIKREGRPTDRAILSSRLIDRPLRPLFPKGFYNDVQVVATVMSVEQDVQPEILAMIGSSVVLSISEAPFSGPTGSVAVGMIDGEYIVNPDVAQREKSSLSLVVAGTKDAVMMVESGANEISEEEMLSAILFAHEEIKKIVSFIADIEAQVGKAKLEPVIYHPDEELAAKVRAFAFDKVVWALDTFDRSEREVRSEQVKAETVEAFKEEYPESAKDIGAILYTITKEVVRDKIINKKIRPDGRAQDEIRPIWCEVGIFGRTHGSAVFTRGQTQVMTIATLGTISEAQSLDGLSLEESKRYMHQYNMPPYSVGEAKPMRGVGRREIGHGALAERALEPVLPSEAEFPYCMRLVSEVISSNGSTSQASICASTLALLDAGVPIKKSVAGVAMGLIKDDSTGNIAILTDIQGLEDFLGDMDFKVAGTRDGITAIQMDIKIKGINREILTRALEQARKGRMFILDEMDKTLREPHAELSPYAPRIITFKINPDKIREVIGSGGKVINKIIADTGVKIDIEDDGTVYIASPDATAAAEAKRIIDGIVKEIEVGDVYLGSVVGIKEFGAFINLKPGTDGLLHISRIANKRVEKVEDVLSMGEQVLVRVIDIDPKTGKISLTRKDMLPPEKE